VLVFKSYNSQSEKRAQLSSPQKVNSHYNVFLFTCGEIIVQLLQSRNKLEEVSIFIPDEDFSIVKQTKQILA